MAKAVVTLYGDDASVYGSLVLTQVRHNMCVCVDCASAVDF